MRFPWQQKTSMQGLNYLDFTPNRLVDSEPGDEAGRVVLFLPRYRDWLYGRLVQPLLKGDRRYIRVPLDARGSWIWGQVDGVCTVGDLARRFREEFPEDAQDVEHRMSLYVGALVDNGFIEVVSPSEAVD